MSNSTTRLANVLRIEWDPASDDGNITYNINEFLVEDGKATSFHDPRKRIVKDSKISQTALRVVEDAGVDPVTGTSLTSISGAGVMLLIKRITDQVLEEVEAEINQIFYALDYASIEAVEPNVEVTAVIAGKRRDGQPADFSGKQIEVIQFSGDPATIGTILIDQDVISIPVTLSSETPVEIDIYRDGQLDYRFTVQPSTPIYPPE